MNSYVKNFLEKFGIFLSKQPLKYAELIDDIRKNLIKNTNVLHVGAHSGQESFFYNQLGIKVIWIEAIPEIYNQLIKNIQPFPSQSAFLALLGEQNKSNVEFYLSNNERASSSIYKFGKQKTLGSLEMDGVIELDMKRLDHLFNSSDLIGFNHWVIDVQGAELNVCKGAGDLLRLATSLEIEVSTRDEYSHGTRYEELKSFLNGHDFFPLWEPKDKSHEDIFFIRRFTANQ